jgi:hypothetical protein
MKNEPFFRREADGRYQPTPVGRGPWNPQSLHGRILIGLLAREIEVKHGQADFMPARLTVDMYRLPDFSAAEVTTRVVRDGNRIRVVDAEYVCNGVSMGRASCQLLKRTQNPEENVWRPPSWNAPKPADIPVPDDARGAMGGMWATRPITGAFGTLGQKRLWMADVRELVGGEPLSPFQRVALASDFASPFANSGDQGLQWINSDVTQYLHRLPRTDWIGVETVNHGATDGVAVAECFLYDEDGPIGFASVAALAQRRMNNP